MQKNIFLDKEILILQNKSAVSKEEILRYIELVTYLAANKEITYNDALTYTNMLITILRDIEP